MLPFMIGNLIPSQNPDWKLFLLLREVMDIVFAFELEVWEVEYLRDVIEEFAEQYMLLINVSLKPKPFTLPRPNL